MIYPTHQETSNLFQLMVLNDLQTLCFTISRKMAELIAMWAKRELNQHNPQLVNRITAYRSGYLASERRKIENGLKTGNLVGVTCTNALELGMDIGKFGRGYNQRVPWDHDQHLAAGWKSRKR